jgi:hypothetical protein
MTCKNCGNTIHVKYCSYCGQEPVKERLTFKEIIQKFAEAFTHADTGVFTLVKNLSIKPADVSREYIQGKRKKYYSPMKYLVLVVTISALLTLHYEKYNVPFEPAFMPDDNMDDMVEMQYFNHNYYKYLIFLAIPLASVVTMLVFRNSGLNFSENLVFNAYIISQVILLHTIFVTPLLIYSSTWDDWIIFIYMALAAFYMLWSYTVFFGGKWWKALIQSIFALAVFTIAYNLISHNLYYLLGKK